MKNFRYFIVSALFFLSSLLIIANYKSLLAFLPTQEVDLSNGAEFGPIVKDYVFVQEITLKKKYINRIDVYLAKIPGQNATENVFVLLDGELQILYTKRFSSNELDRAVYYPFEFKKPLGIGKGNKVYACIYSIDGDMNNYLAMPRKANCILGKLYVAPIQNNDVVLTIQKQQSVLAFEGSLGLKTFESDTLLFSPLRIALYILTFFITLIILFFGKIKPLLLKSTIVPEYAFLCISLLFGALMVVFTPPFQAPDEPAHLYRSYQISEFNFFKYKDDVPQSLIQLASFCDRMKFMAHEKTNKKEILALAGIKLKPENRAPAESPNYTIPYLPQAFGIFIGKLFHLEPFWLFYLGRVFNLLASIALLFIAIKTTPVLKWLFFLLSVMPMTVYQISSLSYDAITISLSFLLIATILNFAFNEKKVVRTRDILILFFIAVLLASAKPPYYIIAFSFLIIPIKKIGSLKKFSLVFALLAAVVIIVSQIYSPGRRFFEKFSTAKKTAAITAIAAPPEKSIFDDPQPSLPQKQAVSQPSQQAQPFADNPYDPPAQIKYILADPIRYMGIMFDTFIKFIGLYLISFIGLFGWVDTPLPPFIVYSYFIVLMVIALIIPTRGIKINFLKKGILLSIFLAGFVLVETAMYLYCNPVGCNPITAVQGRYFIAFGPLLFMLLYNNYVGNALDNGLFHSKPKPIAAKRNKKKTTDVQTIAIERVYTKLLPWLIVAFGLFALIYSLYIIIGRFYIVLI